MNYDETQEPVQQSPSAVPVDEGTQEDASFGLDPGFVAGGKKTVNGSAMVLGGLAVVGAFVVWFMFFRGSPQAADAGAAPADTGNQIKQFLDSGNINLMKQTLKDTEKVVQQFRAYPGKTQVPLAALRTNPFRELPPKADGDSAVSRRSEQDEAKEHARVVTAVTELHLQSIVHGGKYHACMINNVLYAEGQQVGIFTVQQITSDTVVLGSGKYRFELKMQN